MPQELDPLRIAAQTEANLFSLFGHTPPNNLRLADSLANAIDDLQRLLEPEKARTSPRCKTIAIPANTKGICREIAIFDAPIPTRKWPDTRTASGVDD